MKKSIDVSQHKDHNDSDTSEKKDDNIDITEDNDAQEKEDTAINENTTKDVPQKNGKESDISDKIEDIMDRVYICGECGKSYDNCKDANEHLKTHETNDSSMSRSVSTYKCDQ